MIKFVKSLPDFEVNSISLAKIMSIYKAFGGTSIAPDFWIQEAEGIITAVFCLYGSELTFYAKNADLDEIRDFIKVISPKTVFCEKDNVLFKEYQLKSVFLKEFSKTKTSFENNVSLKELYTRLSLGLNQDIYLPSFEDFAGDISHRLRHNSGIALVKDYGAALCFLFDGGGIINGITIDENSRGLGLGSKLLNEISTLTGGKVFACTDKTKEEFYTKNGFSLLGEAAIIEMERV